MTLPYSIITLINIYSDPTPEGSLPLELGVPKFIPYNNKDKPYMHIDEDWEIRSDFTKVEIYIIIFEFIILKCCTF